MEKGLLYDVGVLQFLQDGDFSHCGTGDSFIFILKLDFLESNNLLGGHTLRLVDLTVSALSDLKDLLVLAVEGLLSVGVVG